MSISNFNTGAIFNVNLDNLETVEIDKLYASQPEAEYTVNAILFSTKGKFGKSAMVCFNNKYVMWLPKNQMEVCEQIVKDSSTVDQIKSGKAGFKIVSYKVKEGQKGKSADGTSYSVEWIDFVG